MTRNARAIMKRKLLAAALLLAAMLIVGGAAFAADDPIVCSMEVSPQSLAAPGDVTVTITVSNAGDTDMKDPLTLYSPTSEIVTDFGDKGSVTLKAGEVKTWTGTWSVNQRTLDNGQIVFFVKYFLYKDNGEREAQSQPIRGKLNAAEAKTDIEIKRTISPGTAREGQTVNVIYDIVNTGTISLKSLTITESKDVAKKAVTVAEELKPGEAAQVKFPVTMGKKDLVSSATITYTTGDSKDKQTQKVDQQTITYGEAALTAKLTASSKGVAINGKVTLTLDLQNDGNVNYTDVRVSDKTLGEVFTNQELAAGGKLKLEKEITLTETTDYQFHIVAIDNTGTEVTLDSDALTLSAVDPGKIVHLNVTAAADRTEVYTQPGIVRFTVTVENDSEVDAKDVVIYHGGVRIYTFPAIPAGESRKLTRDAALSMAGKYEFTAVTVDALQNSSSFVSNAIQIAFSVPTPAPETPTPAAVPTPEPTYEMVTVPKMNHESVAPVAKMIARIFMPMMYIAIALLLGAGVLLALATKKRMDQKRASDAALDHLDRAKRRDYANPGEDEDDAAPSQPAKPTPAQSSGTAPKQPQAAAKPEPQSDIELPHMKYVRNAYQRSASEGTAAYGKTNLYDEDPLPDGAPAAPASEDDLYHTYGSDKDLPPVPAPKTAAKPKGWSAYKRRPEVDDPAHPAYDAHAAYRPAQGYATDDAAVYPSDTDYGADGYDAGAYPQGQTYADELAYPEDSAYADPQDDSYVSDPLGYEGQTPYPDEPTTYDPAYDPAYGNAYESSTVDADGYRADAGGYAEGGEPQVSPDAQQRGAGRTHRRSER